MLVDFDLLTLDQDGRLAIEHEHLHGLAVRAAKELSALKTAAGDIGGAIEAAERVLSLDPLQEDTHRALIRLHRDQGQAALAMKQYQRCREVLCDIGVAPCAETEELRRQLARLHRPADVPDAGTNPAVDGPDVAATL